jgi:hypothetical protein
MQDSNYVDHLYFKTRDFHKYKIASQKRQSLRTPTGFIEIIFDFDEEEKLLGIELLDENEIINLP